MIGGQPGEAIRASLEHNRTRFDQLLDRAETYAARGRFDLAAAWAEIAADQAWHSHPGFFVDDRLERLLALIGATLPPAPRPCSAGAPAATRNVLHVLTEAYAIGGHSRFVWRWIGADRGRRHCVVLTRHRLPGPLPDALRAAPESTGGWLRALDWTRLLPVARAARLRALAAEFDAVVLHAHPFDVVPAIAFAGRGGPPVVLLNHAGFSFWVGRDAADVVACLRPSSREVAVRRRGLDPIRCPALPIPIGATDLAESRSQARARLGLPADAVLLCTVADPFKFVPFEPGPTFLDLATALLRTHPQAQVLAIGPGDDGAWRAAREQTGGRVRAFGRHPEVDPHLRAADLYLDPFPVTSPTAFIEAARHALPIVSFCPHREQAPPLCADDFGALESLLVRADTAESFAIEVGRLIDDAGARRALGRATAEAVIADHGPDAFVARADEVYARAAAMRATRAAATPGSRTAREGEPSGEPRPRRLMPSARLGDALRRRSGQASPSRGDRSTPEGGEDSLRDTAGDGRVDDADAPASAGDRGQPGALDTCLVRMQQAAGISLSFRDLTGRHLDSLPLVARQWLRVRARADAYLARRQPRSVVRAMAEEQTR